MVIKVLTVCVDNQSNDWSPDALSGRKFGEEGEIIDFSNSHGTVYLVRHKDKSVGWYEPRELVLI